MSGDLESAFDGASDSAMHDADFNVEPPLLVWRFLEVAPLISIPDLKGCAPVPRPGISLRV
jgi:hypothetical protein